LYSDGEIIVVDEEDEMMKKRAVTNSRGSQGQFPPCEK
jgi:hypothetical protein